MKRILLFLLLVWGILAADLRAQHSFTIPDPVLANWMSNNGYASIMSGNTIVDTNDVFSTQFTGSLNLSNMGISDITGLRFAIWGIPNSGFGYNVDLSYNQLTDFNWFDLRVAEGSGSMLNLSHNQIQTVFLAQDFGIRPFYSIDLAYNQITSFDIERPDGMTGISILHLSYNLLTQLPVINSTEIYDFSLYVSDNNLQSQPRGNYTLLNCDNNNITSLTNDLIDNPAFFSLTARFNDITYFNITETMASGGGVIINNNPILVLVRSQFIDVKQVMLFFDLLIGFNFCKQFIYRGFGKY